MSEYYLRYTGEGHRNIMGVGLFHADLPPVLVSASVANQYKSEAMAALGWEVIEKLPDEPEALTPDAEEPEGDEE